MVPRNHKATSILFSLHTRWAIHLMVSFYCLRLIFIEYSHCERHFFKNEFDTLVTVNSFFVKIKKSVAYRIIARHSYNDSRYDFKAVITNFFSSTSNSWNLNRLETGPRNEIVRKNPRASFLYANPAKSYAMKLLQSWDECKSFPGIDRENSFKMSRIELSKVTFPRIIAPAGFLLPFFFFRSLKSSTWARSIYSRLGCVTLSHDYGASVSKQIFGIAFFFRSGQPISFPPTRIPTVKIHTYPRYAINSLPGVSLVALIQSRFQLAACISDYSSSNTCGGLRRDYDNGYGEPLHLVRATVVLFVFKCARRKFRQGCHFFQTQWIMIMKNTRVSLMVS